MIFPVKLLEVFEPHEIEGLVNGPPQIKVSEWKKSTLYRGYKDS